MSSFIDQVERALIDAWLAEHEPEQCAPCRFSENVVEKSWVARYVARARAERSYREARARVIDSSKRHVRPMLPIEKMHRLGVDVLMTREAVV